MIAELHHPDVVGLDGVRPYLRVLVDLAAAVGADPSRRGQVLHALARHPHLVEAVPDDGERLEMVARHLAEWGAIEARLWEWDRLTALLVEVVEAVDAAQDPRLRWWWQEQRDMGRSASGTPGPVSSRPR
ncbi:hypothetical protein GCM10022221_51790 [Actinocorallia aurea]